MEPANTFLLSNPRVLIQYYNHSHSIFKIKKWKHENNAWNLFKGYTKN